MESEVIFLRKEQGAAVYAEIILNRPEKGNALNRQMLEQLDSIVSQIESDRELRAVVIRARGVSSVQVVTSTRGALFPRMTWAVIGFCMASGYLDDWPRYPSR
jgi:D-alanine-D-alanine ligase-like ATP-grasp enzyme